MNSVLSVQNLIKNFKSNQVLHNVTFNCKKGRIVGLIGANGAGKTTIMKSILGLVKSRGAIKINGETVHFNHAGGVDSVGALIEYPGIYPYLTGKEHLNMLATNENKQAISKLISDLKMAGYIDKRAKNYSLGMRQKLGIAMALVNHPDLVILDEPMNGLDPQATYDLRQLILSRAQAGTTFLISSHILSELQKLANDVIVLDKGRIVRSTTMGELLSKSLKRVIFKTSDDGRAKSILQASGYHLELGSQVKITLKEGEGIEEAVKQLTRRNVLIEDIVQENNDLEKVVLNLIKG
ncbi:ABC transporter ATP-binding protein [Lentilactobacillus fungorum]|uniref:ABC transporter ATP-binding protein n=1 Tax=Lentilactobacillus fungorum TaxID=2201250 RepID=A0ABQ3VZE8_9LACO|nr:ABC transporter ATP-binding protein [Lentilactobacillus fungorum]GHP13391.1 ABC transporter ATP-binding protein [Lentilactobacillus fungorum]